MRSDTMAPTNEARKIFTAREKEQALAGQVFGSLDLEQVDFADANLCHSRFVRVNLQRCDFSRASLAGAEFIECDLRRARFNGAVLGDAAFRGSNLIGATGLGQEERAYVRSSGGALQPWHLASRGTTTVATGATTAASHG